MRRLTIKHSAIAYILNREMGYTQNAIAKLMDYDLIEEIGRLDAPGRPVLFATTEEFLRCFGVSSVAELPQAAPEQIMEFKEEAESEIPVTV